MDSHVSPGDSRAGWQLPELAGIKIGLRMRVADLAARIAMKMNMLVKVRAVAGLGTVHVHLFDQARRGEVLQAVVNRRQRNAGRATLGPIEQIVGSGMVVRLGEDLEDFPAMRRKADICPQDGQTAVQTSGLGGGAMGGR